MALKYYRLALQNFRHKEKNTALTLSNMGYIYLAQGRWGQSLKHFRAALQANPDYENAFKGLVLTLIRMQRLDEAVAILEHAVHAKNRSFAFQELMGQIWLRRNDAGAALPYLSQSVALHPHDWKAKFHLGLALEITGDRDAAAHILRQAQHLHPQDPRIMLLLVLNRLNAGQPLAAEAYVDRLLAGFPLDRIVDGLQQNRTDALQKPLDHDRVAMLLARKVRMQADAFKDRAEPDNLLKPRES